MCGDFFAAVFCVCFGCLFGGVPQGPRSPSGVLLGVDRPIGRRPQTPTYVHHQPIPTRPLEIIRMNAKNTHTFAYLPLHIYTQNAQEGMMRDLAANPVFADPEWHDISRDQVCII